MLLSSYHLDQEDFYPCSEMNVRKPALDIDRPDSVSAVMWNNCTDPILLFVSAMHCSTSILKWPWTILGWYILGGKPTVVAI